jgi:hypothetical protein
MDLSPKELDLATRTVMGEAGGEPAEGQSAVAHILLNRQEAGRYGKTLTDIINKKGAFESWDTRRKELSGYDPKSPEYQEAKEAVVRAAKGESSDPTGGATHFYTPKLQADLGRPDPKWANEKFKTAEIGKNKFYAPEGIVNRDSPPDDWIKGSEEDVQNGTSVQRGTPNGRPQIVIYPGSEDIQPPEDWLKGSEHISGNDVVQQGFDALPMHAQKDVAIEKAVADGTISQGEAETQKKFNHFLRDHPGIAATAVAGLLGPALIGTPGGLSTGLAGLMAQGAKQGTVAAYKALPAPVKAGMGTALGAGSVWESIDPVKHALENAGSFIAQHLGLQ